MDALQSEESSISIAKFGGSWLRSPEDYERAEGYIESGLEDRVIVPFVSAAYGMTDKLEELYEAKDDSEKFERRLDEIWNDYEPHVSDKPEERAKIQEELEGFRKERENLSLAEVMGSGEHHSAHLLKGELENNGVPATALSGYEAGFCLSETGRLDLEASREDIKETVAKSLEDGSLPVIGGYQGRLLHEPGKYAIGGRGSSDLFAVAGAAAVDADRLEIIKDVGGVCPVDPNLWPCRPLEKVSYDEMGKLAWRGNPVVYPTAVSLARDEEVTILVKNLESEGTLISHKSETTHEEPYAGITLNRAQMITIKDPALGTEDGSSYLSRISEAVEGIRLISSDPEEISFTLIDNPKEPVGYIEDGIRDHLEDYGYSPSVMQEPVSMLSVCGDAMKERVGTFAELVQTIADTETSIIMGSQTNERPSAPSISFCVDPDEGEKVAGTLAERLFKAYKLTNSNKNRREP